MSMRTTVSIPEGLFAEGERVASRRGISRSALYALALAEFLRRERAASVAEALDAALGDRPARVDAALAAMQRASLSPDSGS